jgi:hypothetical protein
VRYIVWSFNVEGHFAADKPEMKPRPLLSLR